VLGHRRCSKWRKVRLARETLPHPPAPRVHLASRRQDEAQLSVAARRMVVEVAHHCPALGVRVATRHMRAVPSTGQAVLRSSSITKTAVFGQNLLVHNPRSRGKGRSLSAGPSPTAWGAGAWLPRV